MSQQDKAQKTQKPTPKRIEEFRKQGKVAMSKDLSSVSLMLLGGAMGLAFSASATGSISSMMRNSLMAGPDAELSLIAQNGLGAFVSSCWPVMVGSLAGVLIATGLQLGWPPALKKPEFKLGRPFTLPGLKQIFSIKQAGGRVLKATAKASLVMVVLAIVIYQEYQIFRAKPALEVMQIGEALFRAVGRLGFYSVLVLGTLALIDFGGIASLG